MGFARTDEFSYVALGNKNHVHDVGQTVNTDIKVNAASFRLNDGLGGVVYKSSLLRRLSDLEGDGEKQLTLSDPVFDD